MQDSKRFSWVLSALVSANFLAACAPTAGPNNANPPAQSSGSNVNGSVNVGTTNTTNTPANTGSTSNAGSSSNTSSISANNSAELESSLQAVIADEATIADAQVATDSDFATKAIGIGVDPNAEVSATLFTGVSTTAAPAGLKALKKNQVAAKAETKTRLIVQAKARQEMAKAKKAQLEASGAITVNTDGTLTIKPAELNAFVKQSTQAGREQFQQRKARAKDKLQNLRELAKDKLQKLRRKNNGVRISDVSTTINAEGLTTTIVKVEFTNQKTGLTRSVIRSQSRLEGKLVSAHYELIVSNGKGYERTVDRSVEVLADGSRKIVVSALTKWANGKTRERSEERVVAADGSASGAGTITLNQNDQTTTFTYNIGITTSGDVGVTANNKMTGADKVEVNIESESDSSEVTVVVEENGQETEATVSLEDDADAAEIAVEAEADASTDASVDVASN